MTSGETLLKIIDYPFAYSIIGIVLGSVGIAIAERNISLLIIAGFIGSFLTITDPLGRIVRADLRRKLEKEKKNLNGNELKKIEYGFDCIKTRAIGIETDKIVGLMYFVIILIAFLLAVFISDTFANNFLIEINQETNEKLFSIDSFRITTLIISSITMALLGIITGMRWKEIMAYVKTAAVYQICIESDLVTTSSLENMGRYLEQNDWSNAQKWAKKLEYEIKIKKGKREIIIKASDKVYQPLYNSFLRINSTFEDSKKDNNFNAMPTDFWYTIINEASQFLIEEPNLRKEIESFFDRIEAYNRDLSHVIRRYTSQIDRLASDFYNTEIQSFQYRTTRGKNHDAPNLVQSALRSIHPIEYWNDIRFPEVIIYRNLSKVNISVELRNQADFVEFDRFWETVLQNVRRDDEVWELKRNLSQIMAENIRLLAKVTKELELLSKI